MIRRLLRLSACVPPLLLGACSVAIPVSTGTSNVISGILVLPILFDDGGGRMVSSGGYSDVGWFTNPDSHPAVRPKPGETGPADGTQVHPH